MSWSNSRARGFTLTELMVALVLAGLFSTALFSFLSGQARFSLAQGARREVEQSSRGTLDLMAGELRAVAGDGIVLAEPHRIRFHLPRVWGVLCGPVVASAVNLVLAPDLPESAVFPADYPGSTPWGIAIRDSAAAEQAFARAPLRNEPVVAASAACVAGVGAQPNAAPDSVPPRTARVALAGLPERAGAGYAGRAGDIAYLFQTVTYDVGRSGGVEGSWLRRSLASDGSAQQPLAGPLAEGGPSLGFTYLCGTREMTPPVTNRAQITAVRIVIGMQSSPSARAVLQVGHDTMTVHLRNSGEVRCP